MFSSFYANRRRKARTPVKAYAITLIDNHFVRMPVIQVSENGLFVSTKRSLPPGTRQEIILCLPGWPPQAVTVLIRRQARPGEDPDNVLLQGMGCELTETTDDLRRAIPNHLEETRRLYIQLHAHLTQPFLQLNQINLLKSKADLGHIPDLHALRKKVLREIQNLAAP